MRGKEEGRLGKCDRCRGASKRCGGKRDERDKKETGKKERGVKMPASATAKHPIHSFTTTRKKRVDWFKGQNARTGWRGGGGGYYKNVKRALQPFSRRSAGGH